MKLVLLNIVFIVCFVWLDADLLQRIDTYSGEHAPQVRSFLQDASGDTLRYGTFLLENATPNDLAVLTPEVLKSTIKLAIESRKLPYAATIPEDIFTHFVLPHRVSQEPLENWRPEFYHTLLPLVKDETDIEKAAIIVNLWVLEQMTYKPTHGRDQAPFTTMRRGYGRCEENMIIYIAAARSVGIPCRPASSPYWNFTDSNHAWVEVWTPQGWKYLGEPENSLNRAWFSKTTERATMVISEAYGTLDDPSAFKYKNNMTYLNSIQYYTDFEACTIAVQDSAGAAVPDAEVVLYATSFGGLFPMMSMIADETGTVTLPLGKSTVFAMAYHDDQIAWSRFSTIDQQNLTLTLHPKDAIEADFTMNFLLQTDSENPNKKRELLGDEFYLKREIANLKRKNRLAGQMQSNDFLPFFLRTRTPQPGNAEWEERLQQFLTTADELGGNSNAFLATARKFEQHPLQLGILMSMIEQWNIKELCELPDTTAISDLVEVYTMGKQRFTYADSLFDAGVIAPTWASGTPPQNGWVAPFHALIASCAKETPAQTVTALQSWIEEHTVIDSDFVFSYFSGSLNPLQMLNMHSIPVGYRQRIMNSGLKILGIPVQWKGRLEYHNGSEFVPVYDTTDEPDTSVEDHFSLRIFVDGTPVKPEPWGNFLLADCQETMAATYFDGTADSLVFNGTYRRSADVPVMVQAFTRNANGDAHVVIHTIQPGENVTLHLSTPTSYVDYSARWNATTRRNVQKFTRKLKSEGATLVILRGEVRSEPEVHILNQLEKYLPKLQEKEVTIALCSLRNETKDLTSRFDLPVYKKNLIDEDLAENQWPVVLLLDADGKITFSSVGYNMGVIELVLRQLK
jgi:hypothetical protein